MKKFMPRRRKHKIQKRDQRDQDVDSNAIEILPQKQQHAAKQTALRESMRAEQPTVSSKKRKRMDKYIERKIRKDDSAELIRKLEKAHASRTLGQIPATLGVRRQKHANQKFHWDQDLSSASEDDSLSQADTKNHSPETISADIVKPILGSGLKRSFDGEPTMLPKRKRTHRSKNASPVQDDLPWEGFSSDDDEERASGTSSKSNNGNETSDSSPKETSSSDEDGGESAEGEEGFDPSRTSAFKAWASQQVNESIGFTPSAIDHTLSNQGNAARLVPRKPENDPLPAELQIPQGNLDRKAYSVKVERLPEIQQSRVKLPVVAEEQRIMEAVYGNPVVVLCGATGSGKTTQIPQFLYEAGFGDPDGPTPGMIGITQPRRVAAVSMAQRVSTELNVPAAKVAHQIRYDATVKSHTAIKFMTDGILLREMANDFLLTKYSVVVVDEAHERTVNTDVLLGMLTRCVTLRNTMADEDPKNKPLKLVIMSATLRIDEFMQNAKLFKEEKPPLLEVEGRQFDVDVHFARRTQADYLEEMFQKISKGHKKLPSGGMLVFLTGKVEIDALAKRLREAFPATKLSSSHEVRITSDEAPLESEDFDFTLPNAKESDQDSIASDSNGEEAKEETEFVVEGEESLRNARIHILPMYSMLPTKEQLKIFDAPPNGSRLIVLATNIAETSLTIPGIRYVFDSGRVKEKKYNHVTGVQSFEVGWISKASAEQRKGRAGRTGPGHCYRLYSSAVFERDFEQYAKPEILNVPIEGVVLQLKSMHIPSVVNFPFPTPPDPGMLAKAEKLLKYLGAISSRGEVSELGRQMSHFPLSPRFAKMLSSTSNEQLVPFVIRMVAALATPELFVPEIQVVQQYPPDYIDIETDADVRLHQYRRVHALYSRLSSSSDAIKLMTALGDQGAWLNAKAVKEATQLQDQLSSYVRANSQYHGIYKPASDPKKSQTKSLQQIVAAAFLDQIAIRADKHPKPPELPRKSNRTIDVPYLPLTPIAERPTDVLDKAVFIHPSSVLAYLSANNLPEYIVYSHLHRSASSTISKSVKTRMHALTDITAAEIARLARGTTLMEYRKPLKILGEPRIGERHSIVVPGLVGPKGSISWPLPAQKVIERKLGMEWVVDKVWEDGQWV